MKKTSLLFLCCWIAILSCAPRNKKTEGSAIEKDSLKNDLPKISLTTLDGKKIATENLLGHAVILILFQPDCDHCQREAEEIKKNIKSFEGYQLYFVSADSAEQVAKFASDYKLSEESNVSFATTKLQDVLSGFGPIPAPSLYIYNAAGNLVQKFNGETDINLVLKEL